MNIEFQLQRFSFTNSDSDYFPRNIASSEPMLPMSSEQHLQHTFLTLLGPSSFSDMQAFKQNYLPHF